jgi:ergothioneine biosynthesis protein EgtB
MDMKVYAKPERELLRSEFRQVRSISEKLCAPLAVDDYQIQSVPQTSPPKWHIAHVSWFFETFILPKFNAGYRPFNEKFDYIFNSYYYTHGKMYPRPQRGLLSRPTVEEVIAYRHHIDKMVDDLLENTTDENWNELKDRVTLGLHHEQQHQELLLMDVKHNFSVNPIKPAYREDLASPEGSSRSINWIKFEGGLHSLGNKGNEFCFDNETPQHKLLLNPFSLADRFITNAEFLEFIEDNGYTNPALWLSDGWTKINIDSWKHPLYWSKKDNTWQQFTLGGMRLLNPDEPVCHLSYYEADAFARWTGKRLPLEAELEIALSQQPITGNFFEDDLLHPSPADQPGQWFGDLWAWTASPYMAYPGFKPLAGTIGEYNGKFMSNQMVLRGGSCVTSSSHMRSSYRNFFYPDERWAFTGVRLAEDIQ